MSEQTPATLGATKPVTKMELFKNMLNAESVQEQFANTLRDGKNIFMASLVELFSSDSTLQQCEPAAIIKEAYKAAALKLPINRSLGFAYVLPFQMSRKTASGWVKVYEPVFILGYKGYIQLAMRTGQYKTINANVVYEGEARKVDKLTGEIHFDGERTSDRIIGYFAYFRLLNGFEKTVYVEVEEMARHAKQYSPSLKNTKEITVEGLIEIARSNQGHSIGWLGNFTDMAMKTCVRELLSKWGYMSVEMQEAVIEDTNEYENTALPVFAANKQMIDIEAEEPVTGLTEGSPDGKTTNQSPSS